MHIQFPQKSPQSEGEAQKFNEIILKSRCRLYIHLSECYYQCRPTSSRYILVRVLAWWVLCVFLIQKSKISWGTICECQHSSQLCAKAMNCSLSPLKTNNHKGYDEVTHPNTWRPGPLRFLNTFGFPAKFSWVRSEKSARLHWRK